MNPIDQAAQECAEKICRDTGNYYNSIELIAAAMREVCEPLESDNAMLRCMIQDGTNAMKERDQLRAALDVAEGAGKALIARLEATQGQAFYDVVKPELIALDEALARIAEARKPSQ